MIILFEKYKEFEGFKVGDIIISPYDGFIIYHTSPSGRMLSTIQFVTKFVGSITNFNSSSYNYDDLSRYFRKGNVEIINIIECLNKYPNIINLVNLIIKTKNAAAYSELINVWENYEDFNKYIEVEKYNL